MKLVNYIKGLFLVLGWFFSWQGHSQVLPKLETMLQRERQWIIDPRHGLLEQLRGQEAELAKIFEDSSYSLLLAQAGKAGYQTLIFLATKNLSALLPQGASLKWANSVLSLVTWNAYGQAITGPIFKALEYKTPDQTLETLEDDLLTGSVHDRNQAINWSRIHKIPAQYLEAEINFRLALFKSLDEALTMTYIQNPDLEPPSTALGKAFEAISLKTAEREHRFVLQQWSATHARMALAMLKLKYIGLALAELGRLK